MSDLLDELPDDVAAAAFRRLVRHLRHRHDAENIELMGLAGFCRNCLADWIRDAGFEGDKAAKVFHPVHRPGGARYRVGNRFSSHWSYSRWPLPPTTACAS